MVPAFLGDDDLDLGDVQYLAWGSWAGNQFGQLQSRAWPAGLLLSEQTAVLGQLLALESSSGQPHPGGSDLRDRSGWGPRIRSPNKSQIMLMLLVQTSH